MKRVALVNIGRCALLGTLLCGALVSILSAQVHPERELALQQSWNQNPASQLIFFAVLEGLYRDGLSNDDVDLIIPPSSHGGSPRFNDNLVYACPLCHPAFEALRLYRMRPAFYGLKGRFDRFGTGLAPDIAGRLKDRDRALRLAAIQSLIQRWVTARLDLMRLTQAERTDITIEMDEGLKRGMEALRRLPDADREKCPICEAGVAACQVRTKSE